MMKIDKDLIFCSKSNYPSTKKIVLSHTIFLANFSLPYIQNTSYVSTIICVIKTRLSDLFVHVLESTMWSYCVTTTEIKPYLIIDTS